MTAMLFEIIRGRKKRRGRTRPFFQKGRGNFVLARHVEVRRWYPSPVPRHRPPNVTVSLGPPLYFSHGQFSIYDRQSELPGLLWTGRHYSQGFAKRDSNVSFRTLCQHGLADVVVTFHEYEPTDEYERVISVPFRVITGPIAVEGPEEVNLVKRDFVLPPGDYRLVAAQAHSSEPGKAERISIFLWKVENSPLRSSEILRADRELDPIRPLLESAEEP